MGGGAAAAPGCSARAAAPDAAVARVAEVGVGLMGMLFGAMEVDAASAGVGMAADCGKRDWRG